MSKSLPAARWLSPSLVLVLVLVVALQSSPESTESASSGDADLSWTALLAARGDGWCGCLAAAASVLQELPDQFPDEERPPSAASFLLFPRNFPWDKQLNGNLQYSYTITSLLRRLYKH